jgi:long-chain acyl-CoA synthetase
MNLAENLSKTAAEHPDAVAIKLDDTELAYKHLDAAASGVANLLDDREVEPGDRVGIMLPNVPYFPVIYYGALRRGAVRI